MATGKIGKTWQREGRDREPRRRWNCPDEEVVAAFIDSRLDEKVKSRVQSHLVACDYCRELVAATVRLQRIETSPEVPLGLARRARAAGAAQSRGWAWNWAPATSAAMLVAAALTLAVWRPPKELELQKWPAPAAPAIAKLEIPAPPLSIEPVRKSKNYEAAPRVIVPGAGGVQSRKGLAFRWNAVPNALFYQVRLVTRDGDLIWEGSSGTTELTVPDSLVLKDGKYFLMVSAAMENGKARKAETVEFQVRNDR